LLDLASGCYCTIIHRDIITCSRGFASAVANGVYAGGRGWRSAFVVNATVNEAGNLMLRTTKINGYIFFIKKLLRY